MAVGKSENSAQGKVIFAEHDKALAGLPLGPPRGE